MHIYIYIYIYIYMYMYIDVALRVHAAVFLRVKFLLSYIFRPKCYLFHNHNVQSPPPPTGHLPSVVILSR